MEQFAITPGNIEGTPRDQIVAEAQNIAASAAAVRLLTDCGLPDLAAPVLQDLHRRARALTGIAAALAVAILGVLAFPGSAPAAQAAVLPIVQPVKVVLAGPVATMSTQVVATAPTMGMWGGRTIAVSAPINGVQQRVGYAASSTALVKVRVNLPARLFVLGRSTWMERDFGDNKLTALTVDARQASRVSAVSATAAMPGFVSFTGRVSHYKASAGAWVGSQVSPVQVQAFNGAGWVTISVLTSDMAGAVSGLVAVPDGPQRYRLVRPDGAQVWGAASSEVTADAGSSWDF